MKLIFTLSFLCISAFAFAQKQNTFFLKNNGTYVESRDSADYTRVVSEPDSGSTLYNITEYYLNGNKKLEGKTSRVDPPKLEETCTTYHKSGEKESVKNYREGKLVDNEFDFYPNGELYLEKKYPSEVSTHGLTDINFLIMSEYDTVGKQFVTDGNGYYKGFDDGFKNIIEEGNLVGGKRNGEWKGKDSTEHVSYSETYNNGKLIKGISIGEHGDTVKYANLREVEPSYKGGTRAYSNYLTETIKYPDFERSHNVQGMVIVSFIVEKDGKVSNVKLLNHLTGNLDNEALNAIKNSHKWIPGTQYGRRVRSYFNAPIRFNLGN